jgi:UDP-3-O-[3-hydroxymyristoyl] N-acetylglucosamine deacetylase
VRRPVRVEAGEAWAELRPLGPVGRADAPVLEMDLSVDFTAEAIGRQAASIRLTPDSFRHSVANARTFVQLQEIEQLQAAGLAQGGSLQNAIVVDGATVMNPGGLRMANEFAAHKLVDAVGDLALAGSALHARFVAHRTGHGLNNRLLRALFEDQAAWRFAAIDPLSQAA